MKPYYLFAALAVSLQPLVYSAPVITGELKKWHRVTLTFDGPQASETGTPNPFSDYRLNVIFTLGTRRYVVPGFFAADGNAGESGASSGMKWRVHFAPDSAGDWRYTATFRTGTGLAVSTDPNAGTAVPTIDGETGIFTVGLSDKSGRDLRGRGRLLYTGQHFLRFADSGGYFLKGGADSPENFLAYADFDNTPDNGGRRKTWSPHVGDWVNGDPTWMSGKGRGIIGAINYLSVKGMNVFSFLTMNIGGDDQNVFPYISNLAGDRTRFDCSKLDQWEIVFSHGTRMGMYLHFKTQETENDQLLDGGNVGPQRMLYYRELIARFGHHPALNWNLGEETTQTLAQRQAMAQYFYDHDPYRHNVVLHTYPGEQDMVYTPLLGANSKLTGVSIQINWNGVHTETRKWVTQSASAGKKWVVANDEQGSADIGTPPDPGYPGYTVGTPNQDDIRKQTLWGNYMAGGAGVEYYFGYQLPQTDLNCQDFRSRDRMWDYTRHALSFFRNHLPYWEMVNDDALTSITGDYCLKKPGATYAVYLPSGGTTQLNLTGETGTYLVRWFNPRTGGSLQTGSVPSVTGGSNVALGNPPSEATQDWAVLVVRDNLVPLVKPQTGNFTSDAVPFIFTHNGRISLQYPQADYTSIEIRGQDGVLVWRVNATGSEMNFSLPRAGNYFIFLRRGAGRPKMIGRAVSL